MRKKTFGKFKVGDTITVREDAYCYYFNYPTGKNLDGIFKPGMNAKIISFPPNVTGENTYFILFDATINGKEYRFGEPLSNIKMVTKNGR